MTSSVAETLRAARALIDTPDKWCQGAYGRGERCCVKGAIWRMRTPSHTMRLAFMALRRVTNSTPETFNDTHTHAEVIAALDAAIAAEEATP